MNLKIVNVAVLITKEKKNVNGVKAVTILRTVNVNVTPLTYSRGVSALTSAQPRVDFGSYRYSNYSSISKCWRRSLFIQGRFMGSKRHN